jgi:hypothetical protein
LANGVGSFSRKIEWIGFCGEASSIGVLVSGSRP